MHLSKESRALGPVDDAGKTADRAKGYSSSVFRNTGEVGFEHRQTSWLVAREDVLKSLKCQASKGEPNAPGA